MKIPKIAHIFTATKGTPDTIIKFLVKKDLSKIIHNDKNVIFKLSGYFLFGTKLTRLQMQCFRTKRLVICTPECDDTGREVITELLKTKSFKKLTLIYIYTLLVSFLN